MSSHETLAAAANDRKSRLAHLKSLKRKQAPTDDEHTTSGQDLSAALVRTESEEPTRSYLSGRNYDPEARNVKLGFEANPIADPTSTLEYKAEQLALETKAQQAAEETDGDKLDISKIQPKGPNWDLKRDLEEKMKPINVQTKNAIARIIRERLEEQKKAKELKQSAEGGKADGGEAEEVGMEGRELVEAMHLKEKEAEAEAERERDEEEDVS